MTNPSLFSRSRRQRALILAGSIGLLAAPLAPAASLFWDANGATAGAGTAPAGTWGTDDLWSTSATGTLATGSYVAGSDVVFSAGSDAVFAYGVTVSGPQAANTITIKDGTPTLLGTSAPALTLAAGVTVANSLTGPATLDASLGSVLLGASQSFTNNGGRSLVVASGLSGTVPTGTQTLTFAGTGNGGFNVTGAIADGAGGGNVAVALNSASNTLTLAGVNTYTGGTTLTAGTLNLTNSKALGAGALTIAGGTLDNANGATVSLSNANPINLTGNFAYAGTGGSTLDLGTGAVSLSATRQINVRAGTLRLGGIIAGTGFGLTKAGLGALVLNGAAVNTYTGATTINSGTLTLDFSNLATPVNLVDPTSALTLAGGSLAVLANPTTATSQTFASTALTGGASITVNANGGPGATLALGALTRSVGGAVDFTLPAAGSITTTTPNAANTILGGWATVGGASWAVSAGAAGAPGALSALATYTTTTSAGTTAANYAGKDIDVTSSTTQTAAITPNSLRFNDPAARSFGMLSGSTDTLGSGGILVTPNVGANLSTITGGTFLGPAGGDIVINQFNTAGALTIATAFGNTSGTGAAGTSLTKAGPGKVILTGGSSFQGDINLTGGTLEASITALGASSVLGGQIGTTFRRLNFSNNAVFRQTSAAFNDNVPSATNVGIVFNFGAGGGTLDVPNGTVTTPGLLIDDGTVAGIGSTAAELQGTGDLTKIGVGVLKLGGSATNFSSFTGQIFVKEGTLATGTGAFSLGDAASGTTVSSGATLDLVGQTIGAEPLTISGTGVGGVGALISSSGTNTTANSGAVLLAGDTTLGGAGGYTLSGVVSGTAAVTKIGAGTVTLSGANTFLGNTTILAGSVAANNSLAFGPATNIVTLGASSGTATASISTAGGSPTISNAIFVAAGSTGTLSLSTSSTGPTYAGPITLANNLTLSNTNGAVATLTIAGGITGTGNLTLAANGLGAPIVLANTPINNAGTITNSGTSSSLATISAPLGAAVTGVVQNSLTSRLLVTGDNVSGGFTGTYTATQGILQFSNTTQAAYLATPGKVAVGGSKATLAFNYGGASDFTLAQITDIRAAVGASVTGTGLGLDTTNAASPLLFSTPIPSSVGNFVKLGAGTLNLTSTANAYTGDVLLGGGTLVYAPATLPTGNFTFFQAPTTATSSITVTGALQPSAFVTDNLGARFKNSTNASVTLDTTNSNFTVSGIDATNTSGINKVGAGILTLDGTNTYALDTRLSAGILNIASSTAISTSGLLVLAGGTLQNVSGATLAVPNTVNFATHTVAGSQAITFNGAATNTSGTTATITVNNSALTTYAGAFNLANSTTARTVVINGTGNVAISGVIGNNTGLLSALTYSGTGVLTLSNAASTYTGVTTVSGGTLSVSTLANGGVSSSIGASTSAAANLVLAGVLKYTGSGSSTDRLFNLANNATGTLDASGTAPLAFTNPATIGFNTDTTTSRTLTLTGTNTDANSLTPIIANPTTSGSTTLIKNGTGQWTLKAANTYTGSTTVNSGALIVSNTVPSTGVSAQTVNGGALVLDFSNSTTPTGGLLAPTDSLTLAGGTLSVIGKSTGTSNQTFASLVTATGAGSTIVVNPGGGTLTTLTFTSATASTGSGVFGALIDYSSGTTVGGVAGNNYIVWGDPNGSGGLPSGVGGAYTVLDTGGLGFATMIGGKLLRLVDPGTAGLPATGGVAANAYFINGNYGTASTTTAGSLSLALSGNVTLDNLTVDTTALAAGANLDLNSRVLTIAANHGFVFTGANPYEIKATTGSIKPSAAGAVILNNYNTSSSGLLISAPIVNNSANTVVLNGPGKTTFTGANTYTGAINVNGGTAVFASPSSANGGLVINGNATAQLGTATGLKTASALTFGPATSGVFQLNGFNYTSGAITNNAVLGTPAIENGGGNNATLTNGATSTFAGALRDGSGGGTLALVNTANTLTLSGANTYTGGTTLTGGQITVSNNAALGTGPVALNGGTLSNGVTVVLNNPISAGGTAALNIASNLTLNGNLTGTGTLNRNAGTQSLFLAGDNSGFTGTFNNTAGPLRFQTSTAGSTSATWNFTSGGTVTFENALSNSSVHLGALTGDGSIANNANTNNVTVIVGEKKNALDTYSGVLGGGSIALTKAGTGTQVLTGANTYLGRTIIQNGALSVSTINSVNGGVPLLAASNLGAPQTAALGTIGLGTDTTDGNLIYTGTGETTDRVLDLSGGAALTQAGAGVLRFTSNLTASGTTAKTLTLQGSTLGTGELAGVVANNSPASPTSLVKNGSGSWILSAANTYTGSTAINAGTLVLDHSSGKGGALNSSVVTVNGGSLAVSGTSSLAGGLTLAGGTSAATRGLLDLHDGSINTLNVGGGLTLGGAAGGSVLSFDLGTASGSSDLLAITGAASVANTNIINLSAATLVSGTYTLITAADGLGSGFSLGTTPSGFNTFALNNTATAVTLTVQANPAIVGNAYWTGKASADATAPDAQNLWGYGALLATPKSNFSTTADGLTDALQVPGPTADVIFTATSVNTAAVNTKLDAGYSIRSLSFNTSAAAGVAAVAIDTNGSNLTIGAGGLSVAAANSSTATISGTGTVTLGASQAWANDSSQLFTVSSALAGGAGPAAAQTLSFVGAGSGGVNLAGAIGNGTGGGTLGLTVNKPGSGLVTLSAANTYSGPTTVLAGTLAEAATGSLDDTSALVVNGASAVFDLGANHSDTIGGLTLDGGGVITGTGTSTLTVNSPGVSTLSNGTLNPILAGSGNVVKTTAGTVLLNAANTYTGTTTISAGILKLGNAAALGTSAGITTITNGGTLDLNGMTIAEPIGSTTVAGVAGTGVGGNGALINSSATPAVVTADLTTGTSTFTLGGSGDIELRRYTGTTGTLLTKIGTGKLTLSGTADNVSAAVTLNDGSLDLAKTSTSGVHAIGGTLTLNAGIARITGTGGDALYDGSTLVPNGGVFDLNGASETIALLSAAAAGGTVLNNGAGTSTLTLGGNATTTAATYAGSLADHNNGGAGLLAVTKISTNTQTLSGVSTYTGDTTVNAGVLAVANSGALGGSTVKYAATSTGRLQVNGGVTLPNNFVITGVSGSAGIGVISYSGTGLATITGTVTITGGTAAGGLLSGGGSAANALVFAGPINSTVPITHREFVIVYSGGGSYSSLLVDAGTALVGANNGISPSAAVSVALITGSAGGLDLNGFDQTLTGLTFGASGSTNVGTVTLSAGHTLTLNGDISVNTVTGGGAAAHTITGAGTLDLGSANRTITVADNTAAAIDLNLNANTSGSGVITKTGTGVMAISAATTLSNEFAVSAGTLALNHVNALQNAVLNTGAAGAQTVTFTVAGTNTYNVGGLKGNDDLALGSNILVSGSAGGSQTYAGNLTGNGGFTKTGAGYQAWSAVNGFAGDLNINGGTLDISGSVANATTATVSNGATLLLSGTSTDRLKDTGLLSLAGTLGYGAGNQGSTETVGTLTLTGNSIIDLGASDTNTLTLSGPASLGAFSLSIYNWSGTPYNGTEQNASSDPLQDHLLFSSLSGTGLSAAQLGQITFYSDAGGNIIGHGYQVTNGNNQEIVAAIPEPTSVALLSSVLLLAGLTRRRRR